MKLTAFLLVVTITLAVIHAQPHSRQRRQNVLNTTTVPLRTKPTPRSDCERQCQVTSQYNPVCGSNGNTYNNIGVFQCARSCGQNITMIPGACVGRPRGSAG